MATSASLDPRQATLEHLGETACVVGAGPWFSAVTSAAFADAAREALAGGANEFLFDLTDVRAVDVAGTAALASLTEALEELGCEIAIASTHPGLLAWLGSSPLEFEIPVYPTVADGLGDLLRRPV